MEYIATAVGTLVIAIVAWHVLGVISIPAYDALLVAYERWRNGNPNIVAADNMVVMRTWRAINQIPTAGEPFLAFLVATTVAPLLLFYGLIELEWRLLDHARRRLHAAAGIPTTPPQVHPDTHPGVPPHG